MARTDIQPVHFYNNANENVYNGTVMRNIDVYERTDAGDIQLQTDIMLGAFTITVDNGAIISPGTIPPLKKPTPPHPWPLARRLRARL